LGLGFLSKITEWHLDAGVVVDEEAARQVREALLHDGVGGVHAQRDTLDHREAPQYERKVCGTERNAASGCHALHC